MEISYGKVVDLERYAKDSRLTETSDGKIPSVYEGLVGNLQGYYSRRINIQHRLVYQVYSESFVEDRTDYEGTVKIIRMWDTL